MPTRTAHYMYVLLTYLLYGEFLLIPHLQNHIQCMINLADMYEQGHGVPKRYAPFNLVSLLRLSYFWPLAN